MIEPGHAGIITTQLARHGSSTLEAHPVLPIWAWALLATLVLSPIPAGLLALRDRVTTRAQPAVEPESENATQPHGRGHDPAGAHILLNPSYDAADNGG